VRPRPEQSATDVMNRALEKAGLRMEDIDYCVSTGYGRDRIPFAKRNVSEISCHGRGAQWLVPSIRTVVDVGGQDCKVISVNEKGRVVDFVMNDKCAAGTGRFLEIIQCSVFTEFEAMVLINDGKRIEDIAAGVNRAMARRVLALINRVGVKEDLGITGGVAKNIAVVKNLEELLGVKAKEFPMDPQIIGALGATEWCSQAVMSER